MAARAIFTFLRMRFRFCNDLDCPDWVLQEIAVLSKLTSIKVRMLGLEIVKVLSGQLPEVQMEKIQKLVADVSSDLSDAKGIFAVLDFILRTAAKNLCDSHSLNQELQQLGLPAEHAQALTKVYDDSAARLQEAFLQNSFRLPVLKCLDASVHDFPVQTQGGSTVSTPFVSLKCLVADPRSAAPVATVAASTSDPSMSSSQRFFNLNMSPEKLHSLLNELKEAEKIMDQLEPRQS